MIGLVVAVAAVASSEPADSALAVDAADGVAAIRRCDQTGYSTALARLQDDAFAAMKAANEAVALAARTGKVGAAGDAEWERYKQLTAEVERLRWLNAAALDRCAARPQETAAQPNPQRPEPATVSDQAESGPAPKRFALDLSFSRGWLHPPAGLQASVTTGSGRYTLPGPSSGAYPYDPQASYPPAPWTPPATPVGTGAASTISTNAPVKVPFKAKSMSEEPALALTFAPQGLDQAGWRFRLGFSAQLTDTTETPVQSMTGGGYSYSPPTIATQTVCTPPTVFRTTPVPGLCSVNQTATYTSTFKLFNSGAASIPHDRLTSQFDRYLLSAQVLKDFAIQSPIGPLRFSTGIRAASGWMHSEYHHMETDVYPDGSIAMTDSSSGTAVGLDEQLQYVAELSGAIDVVRPLRWRLSGAYGADALFLNMKTALLQGSTGNGVPQSGVSTVWDAAAEIDLPVTDSILARAYISREVTVIGDWAVLGLGRLNFDKLSIDKLGAGIQYRF